MLKIPKQNLRTPGPTPVPDDIVEAMSNPMINHRGPEFQDLISRVTEQLKQVFATRDDVYILTASGTGLLSALYFVPCFIVFSIFLASDGEVILYLKNFMCGLNALLVL